MKIKGKTPPPRKKLNLPDIISEDLTYYMQFGWKQIHHTNNKNKEEKKYAGSTYKNRYIEDSNEY